MDAPPRLIVACLACFLLGRAVGTSLYPTTTGAGPDGRPAEVVILDADRLRGRAFPSLDSILIDGDLSRGAWKVILARPGCRKCERRLREGECEPKDGERVAVVLDGPIEGWTPPSTCAVVVGRLAPQKSWAFESPLVVRLRDGRVAEAW